MYSLTFFVCFCRFLLQRGEKGEKRKRSSGTTPKAPGVKRSKSTGTVTKTVQAPVVPLGSATDLYRAGINSAVGPFFSSSDEQLLSE